MYKIIIICITVVTVAGFLTMGSCTMHRNQLVITAINQGGDPLSTRLALSNEFPSHTATIMTEMTKLQLQGE